MPFIFLLLFFCVNIATRAKMRGLALLPWVVFTILSVFAGIFMSMCIVVISWMKQYGSSPEQLEVLKSMIDKGEIALNDWNVWFIFAGAFGGYLFIRYRIEKHPKLNGEDKDGLPPQ
jgi:uncharacterized protein YneF (UPF0154 family)